MTTSSKTRPLAFATLLCVVPLLALGCGDYNITNPNTPPQIGNNPTRPQVAAAVDGLIISARSDYGGWVLAAGILGREALRLDVAEPRYITELLGGPLDGGSPFGGGEWGPEYTTIRSGYNLLNVVGTAASLTAAQQNGVRGVTQTMQALGYIVLLDAHTEDSIPVDVNRPITAPPAPFVTNAAAWGHVVSLLDSAQTALNAAGGSFAFSLPSGFAGFNTPATFLQFNRALMARVQAYRGSLGCTACYDSALTALTASFVDTTQSLDLGVYFDFTTNAGDIVNPVSQDPGGATDLVHMSIRDSAEKKSDSTLDNRYLAKVTARGQGDLANGLHHSSLVWIRYPSPSSSIPIIRNEELILLRAEANNGATARNAAAAAADINTIRVKSGGLVAIAGLAGFPKDSVIGLLLRERKYSLLFEGGFRWTDMRRFGRLGDILIDDPAADNVFSTLPVSLAEVLARR